MTAPRSDEGREENVSGACRLGECGYCHGNVDLKVGDGPAVTLLHCDHRCHRDRIRVEQPEPGGYRGG